MSVPLRSEDSDSDDSDTEAPTLSPEERAARTAALVAPLPSTDWGHKPIPASAPSAPAPDRPAREPKLTRNVYEGASDDEDSSGGEDDSAPPRNGEGGEYEGMEAEEDDPAVEGEVDLDLEEEMDEFLKFATETLGLSKEQYQGILGEREKRGGKSRSGPYLTGYVRDQLLTGLLTCSLRSWPSQAEEGQRRPLRLVHASHLNRHPARHARPARPEAPGTAPQPQPVQL